jgi:uncharacterized protein (TIGR02996 family)
MSDEAAFLEALKANPADDTTRLVYADWLDEHNEPQKAEYLRLTCAHLFAQSEPWFDTAPGARIVELGDLISDDWRAAAAGRFDLTVHSPGNDLVRLIKAVRDLIGVSLGEMKWFVYNLPQPVFGWLPLDTALIARADLLNNTVNADIRISGSELEHSPLPGQLRLQAGYWLRSENTDLAPLRQQRARDALAAFLSTAKEPSDTIDFDKPGLTSAPLHPTRLISRLFELRRLAKQYSSDDWGVSVSARAL